MDSEAMSAASVKQLSFVAALALVFSAHGAVACSVEAQSEDYNPDCNPRPICSKAGVPATTCDGPMEKWHIKPCKEIAPDTMKSKDGYWDGDVFYLKAKKQCSNKNIDPLENYRKSKDSKQ